MNNRSGFLTVFYLLVSMVLVTGGCATPEGADGSFVDGVAIGGVMLPGMIVASPLVVLEYGGRVIGEGTKERIYAKPGISEEDFENAICKAEGVEQSQLHPEIHHQRDDTYKSIYHFKKRKYYGRFTQDEIAVKY